MSIVDSPAPIVLFCYNRPWHLQQTVESLKKNTLASLSDLIVYADGPKNVSDNQSIKEVRTILQNITGFKSVTIIAAEKNRGLSNSVIAGVTEILNQVDRVIVMEDDLLSTPDYLSFMNQCLETYQDRSDIFSVTGYCPPFSIPDSYYSGTFLAPRASSWGWGTWKHKWEKSDWNVSDFQKFRHDTASIKRFTEGGEDLWPMLYKQQRGVIESWAIRWSYCQFKNNAFGLYPTKSKIRNIGTDGSGTNFKSTTHQHDSELSSEPLKLEVNVQPDDQLLKSFQDYYRLPLKLKLKNFLKYRILAIS